MLSKGNYMKLFKIAVATLILGFGTSSFANQFTVDAKLHSSSNGTGTGLGTGMVFNMGQLIVGSVGVNDLWNAGTLPRWSNADGLIADLFYEPGVTDSEVSSIFPTVSKDTKIGANFGTHTANGFSFAFGTFVGEIDGTFFKLGTNFSIAAPKAGELNLFYWDVNSNDNSGTIVANIAAIPEASTYALMLSGLAMIGFMVRKRKLNL